MMMDPPKIRFVGQGSEQFANVFQAVNRQPNWVLRIALLVFLLVIGIPIFLLLLVAFLAAIIVFTVLAFVNMLLGPLRGGRSKPDGRKNVRVIERNDR